MVFLNSGKATVFTYTPHSQSNMAFLHIAYGAARFSATWPYHGGRYVWQTIVMGIFNGVLKGYMEATRKAHDLKYWRQLVASDPAMDGTWRRRRD